MKTDQTYQKLLEKMHEVSAMPQQTVGPLTPVYRIVIPYFKHAPWRVLALGSVLGTVFLYLLLGVTLVSLVSIIQHGF
jgi:hypothetical protein